MENAFPLPLLTTAPLINYVPKSMAKIWLTVRVKKERRVRISRIIFIIYLIITCADLTHMKLRK
jgi:hypothetical protein